MSTESGSFTLPTLYLLSADAVGCPQTSPCFYVCGAGLVKTLWEKEKLLVTSNFSFSHSVFFPLGELSTIFIKFDIVVGKLLQFGRV